MNDIDRLRDPRGTDIDAGTHMRAGMRDQIRDSELIATLELVLQRGNRLFPGVIVGRGEVDQIGVVRNYRFDLRILEHTASKPLDYYRIERFGVPLIGVLGKDLKRGHLERDSTLEGPIHAAAGGHMRTQF